ncbi:MAG: cupredoxin domain-containing protein [Candidatus Eremiobacteraeota bacterium]|nr:cupredoxin domain-containing protein [Candidatus Eremiobacteraeota bacterium]MBV8355629.1 cupredoxin domain-containing protein [Candidatus Eremiobacteraeota bacterium]
MTAFLLSLVVLLAQATPTPTAMPSASAAAKPVVTVHLKNFRYVPDTVKITAGQTVEWVNDDGDAHTVTSTTKLFASGGLDTRERWSHTFASPGTFAYFCELHPFMKGAVVVSPPPSPSS